MLLQKFPSCRVPHTNVPILENGGVLPSTSPCKGYRTPVSLPDSLVYCQAPPRARAYHTPHFPRLFLSLPYLTLRPCPAAPLAELRNRGSGLHTRSVQKYVSITRHTESHPTPKAILNISYLGLCTELPDQFLNPECLPSSLPHYFMDPASLISLGPSVSSPQNHHRRCTGLLKSVGHAFLLLRRWGSPVGDESERRSVGSLAHVASE